MKKVMKKASSYVLALFMAASLLPAASYATSVTTMAAETETTAEAETGTTQNSDAEVLSTETAVVDETVTNDSAELETIQQDDALITAEPTAEKTASDSTVSTMADGETITIGTGTSSSKYAPYCNYYKYGGAQMIYKASEIGKSGKITQLAFNVASASSFATTSVEIYMGQTSLDQFASTSTGIAASDLTLVYSGSPTLGTSTGWEALELNTPFEYDNSKNLVVAVYRQSSAYNGSLAYAYTSSTNGTVYRQSDSDTSYASVDYTTWNGTASYCAYRPNIQLTMITCTHSNGATYHDAVAATCTEEGNSAYYCCNDCGATFTDEAMTTSTNPVIAALGHDWVKNDSVAYVAPTCAETGTQGYSCTRCTETKEETIPATRDHNFNADGTCTNILRSGQVCGAKNEWDGETLIEPSTKDIDGTTYYVIKTPDELAWFANASLASGYAGNAILEKDINMGSNSWTPMGYSVTYSSSASSAYKGIFDGNGHTITINMTNTPSSAALFKAVGPDGTVKNVTLEGTITGTQYVAGLVAYNFGTIEKCINKATISSSTSSTNYVAGMAAYNYGNVINCANKGDVTADTTGSYTSAYAGGIVAYQSFSSTFANLKIQYCYNTGAISSTKAATSSSYYARTGGIVAYHTYNSYGKFYLENCYNAGKLTGSQVGGITGAASAYSTYVANQIYTNDWYLSTCGATALYNSTSTSAEPATVTNCGSKTEAEIKSADFVKEDVIDGYLYNNGDWPTLSWEAVTHTLTLDCTNATTSLGNTTVQIVEGQPATFTVTPDDGYLINEVKAGGTVLEADEDGVYTTPAVNADMTVTVKAVACSHKCDPEFTEYVAPTCTETGIKENYQCTICGQHFEDEDMTTPISDIVIPANGHSFDADGICTVCGVEKTWDGETTREPEVEGTTFLVGDAEELAWVRDKMNSSTSYESYNIKLTANIFLSGQPWYPIGKGSSNYFAGTFDGQGYTVNGLNATDYNSYTTCYAGLIGYYKGSSIKNVTVKGSVANAYCSSSYGYAGGIVGYAASAATIEKCYFEGNVAGYSYTGGIVGRAYTGSKVVNCGAACDSISTTKTSSAYIGGIAGFIGASSGSTTYSYVANCYHKGEITKPSDATAGCYASSVANAQYATYLDNCYSTSGCDINAYNSSGSYTTAIATNCYTSAPTASVLNNVTSDVKTSLASSNPYAKWYSHTGGPTFDVVDCSHPQLEAHTAKAATCTEDGNIAYWYCPTCECYFSDADATTEITEAETVVEALGHIWVETSEYTAPTCGVDGSQGYTCSRCQATKTEVVPATGNHTYETVDNGDGTHTTKCEICGTPKPGKQIVLETPVTTMEAGHKYIIKTGNAYNYALSSNDGTTTLYRGAVSYKYGNTPVDSIIWEYTADGYLKQGDNYLSNQGQYQGMDLVMTTDETKAIKCQISDENIKVLNPNTQNGYTYDYLVYNNNWFCYTSGNSNNTYVMSVYEVSNEAATEEHTWVEDTDQYVAPTCTTEGMAHYTCSGCNAVKTETIPATNHMHEVEGGTKATLTSTLTPGKTYIITNNADSPVALTSTLISSGKYQGVSVNLSGSEFDASILWKCTDDGYLYNESTAKYACMYSSLCMYDSTSSSSYVDYAWTIDSNGYLKTTGSNASYPYMRYSTSNEAFQCTNTASAPTDAEKVLVYEIGSSTVLESALEKTEAVAATCTTDGNSAYWYCPLCKKYFSDEAGQTEILKDSWVISATGHNYEKSNGVVKCTGCDDLYTGIWETDNYEYADGRIVCTIDKDGYLISNNQIVKGEGIVKIGDDYYYGTLTGQVGNYGRNSVLYYNLKESKTNGLLSTGLYKIDTDGKLSANFIYKDHYYENAAIACGAGIVKFADDLYYVNADGVVLNAGGTAKIYFSVKEAKTNNKIDAGLYEFGTDGKITSEFIYKNTYYYDNGVNVKGVGMTKIGDDLYYVKANGTIYKNGTATIKETKTNNLCEAGSHTFDANGVMIK